MNYLPDIQFVTHSITGSDHVLPASDHCGIGPGPAILAPFDPPSRGFAMAAMHQDVWIFIRRMDPYGAVESFCPVCFETVCRYEREEDLERAENAHVCDPDRLGEFAYFWNAAQD
jgi:hypothetical protein